MAREALEGAAELRRALSDLETNVATRIGRYAVRAAARILRDAVIAAAPRGPGRPKTYTAKDGSVRRTDYGRLFENIRVRAVRARKQGHVVYEVTTGRAFWGFFLEFGTVKMAARPWMRPVIERMANQLFDQLGKVLWEQIDKQARRKSRGHNGGPPLNDGE